MSSRKKPSHPTMFPNVLQAICDLQDSKGSSIRKIVDQVQTAVSSSKKSHKPRNVVMQVQRALKHGVRSGVLKHKAGKYMFSFGGQPRDDECDEHRKKKRRYKPSNRCKPPKGRKCKPIDRKGYTPRKRKPCRSGNKGGSKCADKVECVDDEDSASSHSTHTSEEIEHEVVIPGRARRRASKIKKIERPGAINKRPRIVRSITRKIRRPKKLPRKTSPEPVEITDNQSEDNDDRHQDMDDNDNDTDQASQDECKNNNNENNNDNGGNNHNDNDELHDAYENYEHYSRQQQNNVPECNNPECLCNLKQEPDDDSAYDNNFDERPPFL